MILLSNLYKISFLRKILLSFIFILFLLVSIRAQVVINEIMAYNTEYSGSIDLSEIPQGFYILKIGNGVEHISTRLIRK